MNKNTLRYRRNLEWGIPGGTNSELLGLFELILHIEEYFRSRDLKMIEIGSHMGESTSLFASSQMFNEIHTIDPHEGEEEFNEMFNYSWQDIKDEWKINTRHYSDIITLHNSYSYQIVDGFKDQYFDFIYIDGAHDYDSVLRDIQTFLPKLKPGGIIAGHDYHEVWPGVMNAVDESVGIPDRVFRDTSWLKIKNI